MVEPESFFFDEAQDDEAQDDDGFSERRRRFQELNIREPNIDAELAAIKRLCRGKKQTPTCRTAGPPRTT